MARKLRGERTRTSSGRVQHVSFEDRAAARRSLWRMKTPMQVLVQARGSEVTFFAVLHMVEILMAVARPLSPRLRQRLEPWTAAIAQRYERLLDDNRRADAPYRETTTAPRREATQ